MLGCFGEGPSDEGLASTTVIYGSRGESSASQRAAECLICLRACDGTGITVSFLRTIAMLANRSKPFTAGKARQVRKRL